ncbi:hypothetical protein AHF37_06364 [Paragonimus kellicotti]|nr:hypothetical protein AHF37_06364 [Paragonimus kellicotti]
MVVSAVFESNVIHVRPLLVRLNQSCEAKVYQKLGSTLYEAVIWASRTLLTNRIYRQVRDASTIVDKELTFGRRWTNWRRDINNNRKTENSFRRPEWKYWGSKSIPNLFKPTYHEPYRDVPFWGRSDRTVCLGEFSKPHTHFTKIVQNSRPRVDYRDSTQVHLALRDPTNDRDVEPTKEGDGSQSPMK